MEARDVRRRRLPARLRSKSHLEGTPDAVWQVEGPQRAVGRIHLLSTKEAAFVKSMARQTTSPCCNAEAGRQAAWCAYAHLEGWNSRPQIGNGRVTASFHSGSNLNLRVA
jgi:hypothetical protein